MTGATKGRPRLRGRSLPCAVDATRAASAATDWSHAAVRRRPAIEAMPTSEPFAGRCLPNRMITKKAIPGISGISQAFSRNHPAR